MKQAPAVLIGQIAMATRGATTAAAPMVVPFVPLSTYYILVAGTGRCFQLVCLSVTRSRAMVFGLSVESRSRETGSREGL